MPGRAWTGVVLGLLVAGATTANMWRGHNCASSLSESLRDGWCASAFSDLFGLPGPDNALIGGWAMLAGLVCVLVLLGVWTILSRFRGQK